MNGRTIVTKLTKPIKKIEESIICRIQILKLLKESASAIMHFKYLLPSMYRPISIPSIYILNSDLKVFVTACSNLK